MKPRLIVLSDLWGSDNVEWLKEYQLLLNSIFEITFYDCCKLGEVDRSNVDESAIHAQFVQNGIDLAVENLLLLETEEINVLAFSIGGTIAWKAGLKGLHINKLFAISSTRLRYEMEKPDAFVKLYYGSQDSHKPSHEWLERMDVDFRIIQAQGHQLYEDPKQARKICSDLVLQMKS